MTPRRTERSTHTCFMRVGTLVAVPDMLQLGGVSPAMLRKTFEAIVVIVLVSVSSSLYAGMRRLSWSPSPGATEYRLYYGNSTRDYPNVVAVGPATQATVDLDDCRQWYFAVTASNAIGESGYSTEVEWLTPMSVEDVQFQASAPTVQQGFQGAVTVTGARFEPGVVLELDHPGWTCPADAKTTECDDALSNRRSAVRLESPAVQDCNTLTAWAVFESTTPGAAPTVGAYTLKVTNADNSSASLVGAFEILLDPSRRDYDKSEYWTSDRIDGLDLAGIMRTLPTNQPCPCCSDATCPNFDHTMDIDGDGWIDGNDLALVYTDHFGLCWDGNRNNWTDQACRTHPSETNPAQ